MTGSGGGVQQPPPAELGIAGITGAARVGEGGFGTVYKAEQAVFGRTVAVKVLSRPGLDGDAQQRFEKECRAIGALSGHPNVVPVLDCGHTAAGQPYVVLDYVPGGTLAQRLAHDGQVPPDEVSDIGVKVAGALASAHAVGVLHRDVKPENVLLSNEGEPQLTDFGVARFHGSTVRQGVITGSLAHAAPEVLAGRPALQASDVYSLASTLYALCAGHAPFARPTDETFHPMLNRILTDAPPDLRARGMPAPLWETLAAALAKDPAARTSSARAFGEALRTAQRHMGMDPTPLVTREAGAAAVAASTVAAAPAPPVLAADPPPEPVPTEWSRPRSPDRPVVPGGPVIAVRPPAAPGPAGRRDLLARPDLLAALAVVLVALIAAAVFALTRIGSDDDDPLVAAPTTVVNSTDTAPPTTTTSAPPGRPTTTVAGRTPTTLAPPVPVPGMTSPPGTAATATTAGGAVQACSPSLLRATVTSDKPSYRNGETAQVTARFENTSGRPCTYSGTTASSQVFAPDGQALTAVQTVSRDNTANIPFEPGTSQSFQASWPVSICSSATTCFPGRYTMVVDVAPFGGGRVAIDVV